MPPSTRFGLALENFTPDSKSPDMGGIRRYAERAEALDFDSLWAWDHILLGSKSPFPFFDSLTVLGALALCTERVLLGTGVLVMPLRNPVVLAKVTSTIDRMSGGRLALGIAAGWYEKEFTACGVPFNRRGKILERNLEVLKAFWTQEQVTGTAEGMTFDRVVMLPKPVQSPRPPIYMGGYVDKVLQRVAERSDGWLTYFYTAQSFEHAWGRILRLAEEAGRERQDLSNVAQLPVCIDDSFETADRRVRDFVARYFDVAPWSESSADSAIRGTVDDCAEQLQEHLDAGAEHIVFVPCDYDPDQVETVATELLPALGVGKRIRAVRR